MTTAIIIDAVAWLLLALAIGLAAGASGGVLRRFGILAFAVLGTLLVFRLLRWRPATRLCVRFPRVTAALIAVVALLAADGLRRWGLTEILGALAVGYAIPGGVQFGQWDYAVNLVARIGRWLVRGDGRAPRRGPASRLHLFIHSSPRRPVPLSHPL